MISIKIDDVYREFGWSSSENQRSVFAKLDDDESFDLHLAAAAVGGVANLDLSVQGLSHDYGLASGTDLDKFRNGEFDPDDYFPNSGTKILGSIDIGLILNTVAGGKGTGDPPKLLTTKLDTGIETTFHWKPKLRKHEDLPPLLTLRFKDGKTAMDLDVRQFASFDTSVVPHCHRVSGELRDFALGVPGGSDPALIVSFGRVKFVIDSSAKPEFEFAITNVEFGGVLRFVNDLKNVLKSLGSGAYVDVRDTGVEAGFRLSIPKATVGVFALQNIAISAGVELPFNGDPIRTVWAFSSRENPFLATYGLFGGGGYFLFKLSAEGIEHIEGALELGGGLCLDFGDIASLTVSVTVGIRFKSVGGDVEIGGFWRYYGCLNVLRFITFTVEAYAEISYEFATDKLVARVRLTFKVDLTFFSVPIVVELERKIGGQLDPPFGVMVSQANGTRTATRFAEVTAWKTAQVMWTALPTKYTPAFQADGTPFTPDRLLLSVLVSPRLSLGAGDPHTPRDTHSRPGRPCR